MIVVDSSALCAFLLREPGQDIVASQLSELVISSVNLSEVLTRMSREGVEPRLLVSKIRELGVVVADLDEAQAVIVAELRENARKIGIGLADCCCAALALHKALPVLTGDRIWVKWGLGLDIRSIR